MALRQTPSSIRPSVRSTGANCRVCPECPVSSDSPSIPSPSRPECPMPTATKVNTFHFFDIFVRKFSLDIFVRNFLFKISCSKFFVRNLLYFQKIDQIISRTSRKPIAELDGKQRTSNLSRANEGREARTHQTANERLHGLGQGRATQNSSTISRHAQFKHFQDSRYVCSPCLFVC